MGITIGAIIGLSLAFSCAGIYGQDAVSTLMRVLMSIGGGVVGYGIEKGIRHYLKNG